MKIIVLLLSLIFISGCITGNVVKETIPEPQVYFCPETNCSKVLIDLITQSNEIHCAFYNLNIIEIEKLLKEKNADVITNNRKFGLMHNKFCILDQTIVTGSFNPTRRGVKDNNNLIVIKSKYLAANYLDEFNELKKGIYGKGSQVKNKIIYLNENKYVNLFCPEDSCKEVVYSELEKAQISIHFMAYSFTYNDISKLLIKKSKSMEVKGIIEKQRINQKYNQFNILKDKIDIKADSNKYLMHHKIFIIDSKTVITGSANPTNAGYFTNDENILIINSKKIAKEYLKEFNTQMQKT